MSECVVRMEMPESCKKCKNPICIWLNDDGDFIADHTIAAVQDFRKKNDDGFPYFCPILCQLPEGHGRLVDEKSVRWAIDDIVLEIANRTGRVWMTKDETMEYINNLCTIVPAERSEA